MVQNYDDANDEDDDDDDDDDGEDIHDKRQAYDLVYYNHEATTRAQAYSELGNSLFYFLKLDNYASNNDSFLCNQCDHDQIGGLRDDDDDDDDDGDEDGEYNHDSGKN